MHDLDQLLDTLVADVSTGTRAPGAPAAIKQARRRRAKIAAASAVAFIAVGGGLAAGTLGGSDQPSPTGEPTTPSSESPTVQESAESPTSSYPREDLDAILAQASNWAPINVRKLTAPPDLRDLEPYDKGPCSGNWTRGAAVVEGDPSKGEVSFRYGEVTGHPAGIIIIYFPSEAHASDAAGRLVENLDSCTATAWRAQPIAQTGAALASSADVVFWIQQKGAEVRALQVPTTDGPPPAGVQVEVVEWMAAYRAGE